MTGAGCKAGLEIALHCGIVRSCSHMARSDAMCSIYTLGILPICQPGRAGHRLEVGIPSGEADKLCSSSALMPGEINCQALPLVVLFLVYSWACLLSLIYFFKNALSSTVPTFSWRLMVLKAMPLPITPLPLCFPNPWIQIFARGKSQMHKQWSCCKYIYFLPSSFPLILLGPQCRISHDFS